MSNRAAGWSSMIAVSVALGSVAVTTQAAIIKKPARPVVSASTASKTSAAAATPKPATAPLATPLAQATPTKQTRVIYFVPADTSVRDDYRQAIANGIQSIRVWYRDQLGGKTFSVRPDPVEICRGSMARADYAVDSWTKVMNDVQRCVPIQWNDPNYRWVVYADVLHQCDAPGRLGAGGAGVTIMPAQDLQGLAGQTTTYDDCGRAWNFGVNRWIGGLGHEFGHALGLPHPPGCDTNAATCDGGSIMWTGYASYPNTYFSATERDTLKASPFISDAVFAIVSAAGYDAQAIAADSLAAGFGENLASRAESAATTDCVTALAGRAVAIVDAAGAEYRACLGYVGPSQINFHVPAQAAINATTPATARVIDTATGREVVHGAMTVRMTAPGLFYNTANRLVSGYIVRQRGTSQAYEQLSQPIDFGAATDELFLVLYGSGVRNRAPGSTVSVTVAGVATEVMFAGPAPGFRGVDQINVRLPRSLANQHGAVDVVLRVTEPGAPTALTSNVASVTLR